MSKAPMPAPTIGDAMILQPRIPAPEEAVPFGESPAADQAT
jgi:hypothetical protein